MLNTEGEFSRPQDSPMRRPSSSLIEGAALQVSAGFFMGDLITANCQRW
jgi:hypothetical protein